MVRRHPAVLIGALALAGLLTARGALAQPPGSLSLSDALARAVEANPTLAAARAARAIDAAGIDAARQRPNPEVSVEVDGRRRTGRSREPSPWRSRASGSAGWTSRTRRSR